MPVKTLDFCIPFFSLLLYCGALFLSTQKLNSTGEVFVCLSLCKKLRGTCHICRINIQIADILSGGFAPDLASGILTVKVLSFQTTLETHAVDVLH